MQQLLQHTALKVQAYCWQRQVSQQGKEGASGFAGDFCEVLDLFGPG